MFSRVIGCIGLGILVIIVFDISIRLLCGSFIIVCIVRFISMLGIVVVVFDRVCVLIVLLYFLIVCIVVFIVFICLIGLVMLVCVVMKVNENWLLFVFFCVLVCIEIGIEIISDCLGSLFLLMR